MTISRSTLLVRTIALLATLSFAGCGSEAVSVWEDIRIVGSSNGMPYAKAVSEEFLFRYPDRKVPIIEVTGTGKGIDLFCGGVGGSFPDIAVASRRMKKAEADACAANGVKDSVEFVIGLDGLVLVQARNGPAMAMTGPAFYQAIARTPSGRSNKARSWAEVSPSLPDIPIHFYAPPASSGTYSGIADHLMKPACQADPRVAQMKENERKEQICKQFREDGAVVAVDEGGELMVRKLLENPAAIGLASMSFLDANKDQLRALTFDGVAPSEETLIDGSYAGLRPMYVYVKRQHLQTVPGLKAFVRLLAEQMTPEGLLPKSGLIPLREEQRAQSADMARSMAAMDVSQLK